MAWLVKSRKLVFGGGLPILSIRNSAPCASWSCCSVNFMLSSRWWRWGGEVLRVVIQCLLFVAASELRCSLETTKKS